MEKLYRDASVTEDCCGDNFAATPFLFPSSPISPYELLPSATTIEIIHNLQSKRALIAQDELW